MTRTLALNIPPDWRFSDLKLTRDPDGFVSFDLAALRALAVDPTQIDALMQSPEDALADLLTQLYRYSVAHHGAEDPAMEALIAEVRDEDVPRYTAAEAAEKIGRSVQEVGRLARAGKLPYVREMGSNGVLEYRFDKDAVDAYTPAPRGRRWSK